MSKSNTKRSPQVLPDLSKQAEPESTVTESAGGAQTFQTNDKNPIAVKYSLDELRQTYTTKSAMIRFLTAEGYTRGHIAKFMNIRYQHVRNVQITPVKKTS